MKCPSIKEFQTKNQTYLHILTQMSIVMVFSTHNQLLKQNDLSCTNQTKKITPIVRKQRPPLQKGFQQQIHKIYDQI